MPMVRAPAKLVADLRVGRNFASWDDARPGGFFKIWWADRIGGRESGHLPASLRRKAMAWSQSPLFLLPLYKSRARGSNILVR